MTPVSRPELLSSFNPSTLTSETLEAIFVHRESLAQRIAVSVAGALDGGDREHHLVIGPRGMGKTHLVSVVAHRLLSNPANADRMALAWLREEEWGVTSIGDLYERILSALADGGPVSAEAHQALDRIRTVPVAQFDREAELALTEVVGARTLVVVLENLDLLFDDIGEHGQHALRAYLQNERNTVLVATTPSLNQSVSSRKGLFFGFFALHQLQEFQVAHARELLSRIATWRGDDASLDLAGYLASDEAGRRMRAVQELAGGNPRLWVILSECVTTERLNELIELFVAALNDLTPYYQSQMRDLSAHQRKVVMALSRMDGAVSPKEVAERCRIDPRSAAKHLSDLTRLGYTRVAMPPGATPLPDRRTTLYELREPLLRHCLEVKETRGQPLRMIVGFLRAWYDTTALESRLSHANGFERAYLNAALRPDLPTLRHDDRMAGQPVADLRPDGDGPGDPAGPFNRGNDLFDAGRFDEALAAYDTAITLNPDDADAHYNRGVTLFDLGRLDEALHAFDTAITHNPEHANAHIGRGVTLERLGRLDEALHAYNTAITLNPELAEARYNAILLDLARGDGVARLDGALAAGTDTALHALNASYLVQGLLEHGRPGFTLATTLAGAYRHAGRVDWLASAVVTTADETDPAWLAAWTEALGGDPEAASALRILAAGAEVTRTGSGAALMRLNQEERRVLIQVLGLEDDEEPARQPT